MGQTIYFNRSKIPFSVSEWDKIKSYANYLARENGAEIEDRSEGLDEIHLLARSDDLEHWTTESFCLFQAINYDNNDEDRGYNFNFVKTYHVQPFESVIISILKFSQHIAPWVIMETSSDSVEGVL